MIPAWASDYVGISYHPGGRTRDGADCWGLYRLVRGERWGQWLAAYDRLYPADTPPARHAELIAQSAFLAREVPAPGKLGDAVFLRIAGVLCHVGMVVGGGMMLHVRTGCLSAIEPYDRGLWSRRVAGFRRP